MPVGYTQVTAQYIQDSCGNLISNATAFFQPVSSVTGMPISFRAGGNEGAVMMVPVAALVSYGTLSIQLVDTSTTFPVNIGYSVRVIDNITGNSLLGPGYGCIQPSGASWSLDTYEPNLGTLVTVQTGPQGAPGIPGGVAGTMFDTQPTGTVDGTNATFSLPGAPAILILTKNGLRQNSGTDYTLSGETITFTVSAVPQAGETLWATGITPAAVTTTSATSTVSGVLSEVLLADTDGNTYAYGSRYGQLSSLGAVPASQAGTASVLQQIQIADTDGNTYTYVSRYGQLARL